ncbi:MAG TPA: HlyD family type I secretion periplasmic adaptor subunit [Rhodospirillaceae bacterium]|nr:HlyD family type I secretion periplasmic adaptor subunit [Rhodospirillaceae bacterium]
MQEISSRLSGPEILASTRRRIRAGMLAVAVTFGGGFGWMALAPLNAAAVAPGVIGADDRNKVIQHLEGGVVSQIAVHEGESVSAGQLLLRLDPTKAKAQSLQLQDELDELTAMAARLEAERDSRPTVVFPADLAARRQSEPEVERILRGQEILFAARGAALANERDVLVARIGEFTEEIGGLEAGRAAAEGQIALLDDEIQSVRRMVEANQQPKPRLLALQRDRARLAGERGNTIAQIARARQNIGESRLRISQLDADRLNQVAGDLRDTEARIYDTAQRLQAARDVLARTEIRAPIDGTVVRLNTHTVGGVVQPGEALLELVPAAGRLLIDAHLKPTDIAAVKPGQTAEIRLDAYSQRRMPMIFGTVVEVSADALRDRGDTPPYYLLRVAVDRQSLARLPEVHLAPGMPAEVMVVTGTRTLLDYVLMPIATSLRHALIEQ